MVDPVVLEFGDVENIVASKSIGINDAVRLDFPTNNGHQRIRFGIRNRQNKDFAATLQKAKNRHFASSASSSLALSDAAKITLIGLNFTAEQLLIGGSLFGNQFAQLAIKERGGIGLQTQHFWLYLLKQKIPAVVTGLSCLIYNVLVPYCHPR